MTAMAQRGKGTRPRGEVRALLLEAAQKIFAERGYAGTPTRAICAEAGVAHSLLHFHFPSKSALFEAAVNQPLIELLEEFTVDAEEFLPFDRGSLERECRTFITRFFDVVSENRKLLLASLAAELHPGATVGDGLIPRSFNGFIARLAKVVEHDYAGHGVVTSISPESVVRLTIGMVLATVLLDQWTWQGPAPRACVIDDIVTFVMSGIATTRGVDV